MSDRQWKRNEVGRWKAMQALQSFFNLKNAVKGNKPVSDHLSADTTQGRLRCRKRALFRADKGRRFTFRRNSLFDNDEGPSSNIARRINCDPIATI
jgi:hypothetical protein